MKMATGLYKPIMTDGDRLKEQMMNSTRIVQSETDNNLAVNEELKQLMRAIIAPNIMKVYRHTLAGIQREGKNLRRRQVTER